MVTRQIYTQTFLISNYYLPIIYIDMAYDRVVITSLRTHCLFVMLLPFYLYLVTVNQSYANKLLVIIEAFLKIFMIPVI